MLRNWTFHFRRKRKKVKRLQVFANSSILTVITNRPRRTLCWRITCQIIQLLKNRNSLFHLISKLIMLLLKKLLGALWLPFSLMNIMLTLVSFLKPQEWQHHKTNTQDPRMQSCILNPGNIFGICISHLSRFLHCIKSQQYSSSHRVYQLHLH